MKKGSLEVVYWFIINLITIVLACLFSSHKANLWVVAIGVVGFSMYSIFKSYKTPGYLPNTLAILKNNRKPVYDYIRIIAVVFIISVHILGPDWENTKGMENTIIYHVLNYIRCFTGVSGDCLFIMISGALLLGFKEESVLTFYRKRLTKVAIPLVIYYLFYLWQYDAMGGLSVLQVIKKIITADYTGANVYHFWLIYIIISLYVIVPFLRYMLKDMPYKVLTSLVSVMFIYYLLTKLIINESAMPMHFSFWLMMFIMGYWYGNSETRKYDNIAIALGLFAAIIFGIYLKLRTGLPDDFDSEYPLIIPASIGIMAIFFKLQNRLKNVYLIRLISKYSYGIILVHMLVINFAVKLYIYKYFSALYYQGLGFVLIVLITLIGSLITAYFIDNIFVNPITALLGRDFKQRR